MKIINQTRDTVLADKARIADSFLSRLVGLLNCSGLHQGEALVLSPSNSIHSFFMRFTFDAIFLNRDQQVIAVIPGFKPFRISRVYFKAITTIELPPGTIHASKTQFKDKIKIQE
jgi:uncharacterized membrane protein (UPF0127 family)